MTKPLYVLAGQSNAQAMRDAIRMELEARHGPGGFVLVEVAAAGAPLTFKRSGEDWAAGDELRQELVTATVAALQADPEARVAGLIWLQGEGDTHAVARADTYATRLADLVEDWRTAVATRFGAVDTGIGTAPVALASLSARAPAAQERSQWGDVIAQQQALAEAEPLFRRVDPDPLMAGLQPGAVFPDCFHYAASVRPTLATALIAALSEGPSLARGPWDDLLTGTAGADALAGGRGDDTYLVNHAGDRIDERAGGGNDTVIASITVCLRICAPQVETLTLTGLADLDGTGNSGHNVITGNAGNNLLRGGRGDDALFGGAGNDTFIDARGANRMAGGPGDDTYVITGHSNRIVELEGEGWDTVRASVDITLRFHSQHIEDLVLTGRDDVNGTGNGFGNLMLGNGGDNRLDGAWGDDDLRGRGGDDRLIGHMGNDTLTGGAGRDTFVFAPGHGVDVVRDFTPGEDRLELQDRARTDVHLSASGGDTLVTLGGGDEIRLFGVQPTALEPGDILFL
ncbi:sialate O-acetylesterase [Albibacillus kandeliae]|uniref:sialate O-acetylesterase n=1 Tax=Albibacillus kandeliae TaxID=2174228 RepID=UPI0013005D43|nr:sialate O-acetylesterase [Albibacillus kandeliae]